MKLLESQGEKAKIEVSLEELLTINNALNEVCHGIDLFEFETRIGAKVEEVGSLLKATQDVIRGMKS